MLGLNPHPSSRNYCPVQGPWEGWACWHGRQEGEGLRGGAGLARDVVKASLESGGLARSRERERLSSLPSRDRH